MLPVFTTATKILKNSGSVLDWCPTLDSYPNYILTEPFFSAISNKLRELSKTTDILSENPTTLQDEVMRAVSNLRTKSHESPR